MTYSWSNHVELNLKFVFSEFNSQEFLLILEPVLKTDKFSFSPLQNGKSKNNEVNFPQS